MSRCLNAPVLLISVLLASGALAQQAAPVAPVTPDSMPPLPPAVASAAETPSAAAAPVAEAPSPVALPDTTVATASPPPVATVYSYGTAPYSLLFTQDEIAAMKKALSAFESVRPDMASTPIDIQEAAPPAAPAEAPKDYPVFYLSSIAYRTANDWTVWLGKKRITPQTNKGEVTVEKVTPERVWFHWQPDYIQSIAAHVSDQSFNDVKPVANRLAVDDDVHYDDGAQLVSFSLRPNQSFVAGYFHTFEGNMPAPGQKQGDDKKAAAPAMGNSKGKPMSVQDAHTITNLLNGAASGDAPDRANMQQMIENQSRIAPKSMPDGN